MSKPYFIIYKNPPSYNNKTNEIKPNPTNSNKTSRVSVLQNLNPQRFKPEINHKKTARAKPYFSEIRK